MNEHEEEALELEPIYFEGRGIYTSKSADVIANNGRGKLNEDQLKERAILHAKHQFTGIPSVNEIVDYWLEKYNITMTTQSENEWARNNQDRIDMAAAQLEDGGDMPVVAVSPSTVATMLARAGRDMVQSIRDNKKTQASLNALLVDFTDPYKQIGAPNKEAYWSSKEETRKEYDKRLDHAIKLNKSNVENYNAVTRATVDQAKVLVDMLKVINDINLGSQTMDKAISQKLRDEIKNLGLKQQQKKNVDYDNPLEPIRDEDRI